MDELRRQIKAIETGQPASAAARESCTRPLPGPAATGGGPGRTPGEAAAAPADGVAGLLAPQAGLHEVCPAHYLDTPAALAFQAGMMAAHVRHHQAGTRALVWVVPPPGRPEQDFGRPYPPALKAFGLDPDHVLLVEAKEAAEGLWAMEAALQAGALVMGETGRSAAWDLTASKRLHRAASARQGLVLVLRPHDGAVPSAARTRWRIAARPSPAQAWQGANGLPGLGPRRFHAALERVRGGPPRAFDIEWKDATFHVLEPAPLADREAADPSRPAPGPASGRATGGASGGARVHRLAG